MIVIIIAAAIIFIVGFLLGWGMKSDIRNGSGFKTPEDRIISEMRLQRANDYVNNPVVNEMRRHKDDGSRFL